MILDRLFPSKLSIAFSEPGPLDDFWYGPISPPTAAGVPVDENRAMNYSACWAATRLLAGSGSHLPLNLYRKTSGGGKEIAYDHPLQTVLHDAPNSEMGAMSFRAASMAQQINRGNCYAEIERDPLDRVRALWPIHASRVTAKRDKGGLYYSVRVEDSGPPMRFEPSRVFHVPSMMSEDGITGKGVVQAARESIGFGLATEIYGASMVGNNATPSIVIKHPGKLSDTARANFRREWNEIHQGARNAGKMALLQEGADAQALGFSPEDAQFIATRQHNIEEIARWYGVPPHLIGHLLRSTFSNIENQGIEYVIYSLIPWLKLWEQEIWRKLLTREEQPQYYAKHVVDALLRGDTASRTEALAKRFLNGAINLDEWREIEDLNPLSGETGQIHFVPLNMVPLDIAAKGPQPTALPGQGADGAAPLPSDAEQSELLDVPDYRQAGTYDCGCVCVHAVADFFQVGENRQPADYVAELEPGATGVEPETMVDWFNDAGLVTTSGPGMTVENLQAFCEAGAPVIVPVQMYGTDGEEAASQAGHYVTILGVGLGQVFFHDPVAGRSMLPQDEFEAIWNYMEEEGEVVDHFGIAVSDGFVSVDAEEGTPEEPAADDEPEKPPPDDKPPADPVEEPRGTEPMEAQVTAERLAELEFAGKEKSRAAVNVMLADALGRMLRKETNAIRRAASKPKEFFAWMDEFYPHHAETMKDALTPAGRAASALGIDSPWGDAAILIWIEISRSELLTASETTADKFAGAIEELTARWERERVHGCLG